jgi:hypothetical protein
VIFVGVIDCLLALIGFSVAILLSVRTVQSIKNGQMRSFYGEKFEIRRRDEPIGFWLFIALNILIIVFFLYVTPAWMLEACVCFYTNSG